MDEERRADLFRIAQEYESGSNGRPKDAQQAAANMIKAAEAGHLGAVYLVCAYYVHGRGVVQDLECARAWAMKLRALGGAESAARALAVIDEVQQKGYDAVFNAMTDEPSKQKVSKDFTGFAREVAITLLGFCLLAGIGYCSGGPSSESDGLDALPDNVRKP